MADQSKSTRPAVSEVFRESFLSIFERPEHEAALRVLGGVAHDLAWEGKNLILARRGSKRDESMIAQARGAVGDLRQAAEQLRESAQALAEIGSEEREVLRITLAVADTSAAVQPLADQLDAALASFLTRLPEA